MAGFEVSYTRVTAYPITIEAGLAERLPEEVAKRFPGRRPIVLTDEHVYELHRDALPAGGASSARPVTVEVVPAGERSKSPEQLAALFDRLIAVGADRRSLLIAWGGGMICDLVGTLAATFMRGLDYLNVPTSLLAQVDAAVGGKVAVNHRQAKNLIGAFHHPAGIFIDPLYLRTLPVDEVRNGLAEVIKVAIIHDRGLFEEIEAEGGALLAPEACRGALPDVITAAVRAKIDLLAPDPFEEDLRRSLNFGHTAAHPLETCDQYRGLRHGFAVAIGMAIATRIARARDQVQAVDAERIFGVLRELGLPTAAPRIAAADVWSKIDLVRKIRGGHLHYVLPTGIGSYQIVDDVTRREFLTAYDELPKERPREGSDASSRVEARLA